MTKHGKLLVVVAVLLCFLLYHELAFDSILDLNGIKQQRKDGFQVFENRSTCEKALLGPARTPSVADEASKLWIGYTPKGGATLATQLLLRHVGLCPDSDCRLGVHGIRTHVARHNATHRRQSCTVCASKEWTCLQLIRSPLDRVVSSYLHVMKNMGTKWLQEGIAELNTIVRQPMAWNASFADFCAALELRRQTGRSMSGEMHYLPQAPSVKECNTHDILLVPTESIEYGLEYVAQRTKGELVLNATGLTSGHYVPKAQSPRSTIGTTGVDSSQLAWKGSLTGPQDYNSYLQNATVNALICRLFCQDLRWYAQACRGDWISRYPPVQVQCQREQARVLQVCGSDYATLFQA